jgi:putative protease
MVQMRKYTFAAKAAADADGGYAEVEQRNKFCVGDELEVLSPYSSGQKFTVGSIEGSGGPQDSAPHPQQLVRISCPVKLHKGDLLRRLDA